jgi:hypothetical protein
LGSSFLFSNYTQHNFNFPIPSIYVTGNGQPSPRLDKSFTSSGEEVRCAITKLWFAQLTFRSDQALPTDTAAPAPSTRDQSQQRPSDDKPDDVLYETLLKLFRPAAIQALKMLRRRENG